MNTLIVADVHEDVRYMEAVNSLASKADAVVAVGDYWDSWNKITPATFTVTQWVKSKLSDPKWKLLLGNHDIHYAFPNIRSFRCSGYDPMRHPIIDPVIARSDWGHMRFHTWVGPWLITHAGLCEKLLHDKPEGMAVSEYMDVQEQQIWKNIHKDQSHPWLEAGWSRGGRYGFGGIVWADWSDMKVIPGVNQICGHTEGLKIRQQESGGSRNVCIDTQRRHVAWIDGNGVLTFERVKD